MNKFYENQHARLLEEKKEALSQLDAINEGLKESMRDSIGELSMYDNHPGDIGSEVFEREKDFALRDATKTHLTEINTALASIEEGVYGTCASCGKTIPQERLEAIPEAIMCLSCKDKEKINTDQVISGSEINLQPMLSELMQDNDASARFGDINDYPNIYDDWDNEKGWVEDIENIHVYKGADGMLYADNPQLAEEIMKGDR